MPDTDISGGLSAIASRGISFFTGLGLRILVHFSSLVAGGIACASLNVEGLPWASSAALFVSAYIGLVCLLPRGMGKTVAWLVPTGLGFFQCLFWAVWGVPWQIGLLWGGVLTWTIRLLAKNGDLGWEWAAAPWLLIAMYGFFSHLRFLIPVSVPFWSLVLLAPAGWAAIALHTRRNYEPLHRAMLAAACKGMAGLLSAQGLPYALTRQTERLAELSGEFSRVLPRMDTASAALIVDIDALTARLARHGRRSLAWGNDTDRLARDTEKLNARLGEHLRTLAVRENPLDRALAARIEEFLEKIQSLSAKKQGLPSNLWPHIEGIAGAAKNILDCMRSDPRDVAPADKFLSRYLTAAHTVLDEYVRLSAQGGAHDSVSGALLRSGDLLKRLESAFVDEHGRLLQNDTINFTAELNVLDKLLKMEGR